MVSRFSPEVKERAVKLVEEQKKEHGSQWAAICSVAVKIGCTPETMRRWIKKFEEKNIGGLTVSDRDRLKQLERENRELKRSNEILRAASAFFAKAEFDRLNRS